MVDLKQLIDAGVHFGHKTSRWSPKMAGYIWGARNGVHLIDVSKTAFLLKRAGEVLCDLAKNGGQILLVGTKKSARESILKAGQTLNIPRVIDRWIGGTLTNNEQVRKAVTRLLHLRDVLGKGELHVGKKELSMLTKEISRLERNVGGIIDMHYPPAALVVVDAKKEYSAIREASYLGIPIIGLVDTNTDPEGITCVIPGNDDSPRAVACIINYLTEQIAKGQAEWEKNKPEPTALAKAAAPAERNQRHGNNRPQRGGHHARPERSARPERTERPARTEATTAASAEAAPATRPMREQKPKAVQAETTAPAQPIAAAADEATPAAKPAARKSMTVRKPAAAKKTEGEVKVSAADKPAVKKAPKAKAE